MPYSTETDSFFYRNMTLGQSAGDTNLNFFLFKRFISKLKVKLIELNI